MAEKQTYEVLRQMDGDKQYFPGDTRELTEAEAGHLVALGVLRPAEQAKAAPAPATKAEPAPTNKAESAPANKAKSGSKTRRT